MIIYNNRYRGPYQYDKFVLNILSLFNAIEQLETIEIEGTKEELLTLKEIHDEVILAFKEMNDISEKAYISIIKEEECIKL